MRGGIVIVVIYDTSWDDNEIGPTVISKFDSTGAILWQRYNPVHGTGIGAYSMIESRSGDIVICGVGYGISEPDTIPHRGGCIYKLDGNGNLIFKQMYDYDTTWLDELDDITEMDDGGYACIGVGYEAIGSTNYGKAWLLKVDSNGCLNGDCPTLYSGIHAIPPPVDFFVFPSPASERYTVALGGPGDIDRYHDLTFSLYDLSGRLAYSQAITQQTTPMSRGSLAEGLYIWTLSDDSGPVKQGKIAFR